MMEQTVAQTSALLSVDERDELEALRLELSEARRQREATSEILRLNSSSPTNLQHVFGEIAASAARFCDADDVLILKVEGSEVRPVGHHGLLPAADGFRLTRGVVNGRAILESRTVHIADLQAETDEYPEGSAIARRNGYHTMLTIPLIRAGNATGSISLRRIEKRLFDAKHVGLLETFANQAVIAIENARLFAELRTCQKELAQSLEYQSATAKVLSVIAESPNELRPALEAVLEAGGQLCSADRVIIHLLDGESYVLAASRGVPDKRRIELQQMRILASGDNTIGRSILERDIHTWRNSVPDISPLSTPNRAPVGGSVPLIHNNRVAGVLTLSRSIDKPFDDREIALARVFADQAVIAINNVGLFEQEQARTKELSQSLEDLRTAQDRLVQTEKLASLGQLTAGIAHEIKNPLNFVNNFADLSLELVGEIEAAIGTPADALDSKIRDEVVEIAALLKGNLTKVVHHGRRADSIVKNMLAHSRQSGGERRRVDLNAAVEEALNLSYHGARAENPVFKITLERDFDANAGQIELYPQEFTRVLLNLIGNGFYAANKKRIDGAPPGFEPILRVLTRAFPDWIEIRVRDNGTGIPDEVKSRIFEPFFTTKPTGEGTGLGLSLAHDIVVKQHGGTLNVETKPGNFTEFTVKLPRNLARTS